MKKEPDTEHYTDRDWELIAASLSGEESGDKDLSKGFREHDEETAALWNEIGNTPFKAGADVEKAWSKVSSRINTVAEYTGSGSPERDVRFLFTRRLAGIAAGFIVVAALSGLLLTQAGVFNNKIEFASGPAEKKLMVNLPDGSTVTLNRNTALSYRKDFGKESREVKLTGEAFFDITADPEKPFVIDAGKASVKVIGTSFNVITNNSEAGVEVFVKTGKVLVTDNNSDRNIAVEPGYIGVISDENTAKRSNTDPNYMAWNTGILTFNGQILELVFNDLRRVYDIEVISEDKSILSEIWTFEPIDNEPAETIIKLICGSFNLSYLKDGDIYHLTRK